MDFSAAQQTLKSATCPEDVFGVDHNAILTAYRSMLVVVHPDHHQGKGTQKAASEAFLTLTKFKGEADRKIQAGTYGKKDVPAARPKVAFRPLALELGGNKIILMDHLSQQGLTDVYQCVIAKNGVEYPAVLRIVKDKGDNDLLANEVKTLKKLVPETAKLNEGFYRFFPRAMDTFVIREPASQRKANLLPWFPEHRSLVQVLQVYPDGIDYRDMAWMFKRILHGVGFAHENQILHGAILPPHILIHPIDHGAKLIDWCYAVDLTEKRKSKSSLYDMLDDTPAHPYVKAIDSVYKDFYPPEVLDRSQPSPATDIYMAAKCAVALVGGDVKKGTMPSSVPEEVKQLLRTCMDKNPKKRPQDAWDLHESFDKVLSKVVGKRAYRPFPMP